MRILLVSQWFDPEPFYKGLSFARELTRLGHAVEVLTGFPNYPEGRLYQGYRARAFQRETMEGIPIVRVPLYPSHDKSSVRRIANYSSFSVSAATVGALLVRRPDVAYVYQPPATAVLPVMVFRLLRGTPYVLDVQDLWPDSLEVTGMFDNRVGLALVSRWCSWSYSLAGRITVLSPGFKRVLCGRGVPADKIEVVHNWCDESIESWRSGGPGASLTDVLPPGAFNVVFAGNMGKAQGLEAVLLAAGIIRHELPKVLFTFLGAGVEVEDLKAMAARLELDNVVFVPPIQRERVGGLLSAADILLVHLKPDPLFSITIPSKTQAYMAIGRPILMAVAGDAARLVERAGAGISCTPGSPESIAAGVRDLYEMSAAQRSALGAAGRSFYDRELAFSVGVQRLAGIMEAAAGSGSLS